MVMKTPARAKEITLLALYPPVVVTVLLDPAWSLDTRLTLTLIKNNFVAKIESRGETLKESVTVFADTDALHKP